MERGNHINLLRKSAAIVLAALLLFLTACSGGDDKTQGEVTVDPRLFNSNASLINATEDTVYFMTGRDYGSSYRISYMDKATGYAGVLCGKPECPHANSDCNAWVDGALVMTVSKDRIFWADMDYSGRLLVYSIALDGTDRRTEWASPEDYVRSMGSRWLKVYGDVIYFAIETSVVVDGEYTNPISIIAILRGSGEVYDVLPFTDEFDSIGTVIFPTEEGLFYCGKETVVLGEDEWGYIQHIRFFDLAIRETQALYDGFIQDMSRITSIWPVEDGLLIGGSAATVYKLRYDTREIEPFLEIEGIDVPSVYLGDGLAVAVKLNRVSDPTIELLVENFDGEQLSYATYPPFVNFMSFEGYDSDYFYFGDGLAGNGVFSIIPRDSGDVITLWDGQQQQYRKGT